MEISQSHVSQLSSCKGRPSTKLLDRMAQRFDVHPRWLCIGLGWMATPHDPHAWLAPLLRLVAVQRIVTIRFQKCLEGMLIETPDGVASVKIHPAGPEEPPQSYIAILNTLKEWGGPVGRVVVQPWQEERFESLDLTTLLKDAMFANWILYDELVRLKPRGAASPSLNSDHLTAEIRHILQQLDRELHEVIEYTNVPDFDPTIAAELMGRFGQSYNRLDYHRFTGLLVSMDELQQ